MEQIHRLDNIAEVRHVVEAVILPKRKVNAMTKVYRNGKVFGKVGMRRFIGNKHRLREVQPWDWQPTTLRENDLFRNKREDRGKHLLQFVPCANAPKQRALSFYDRNMLNRYGRLP